MSKYLSLSIKEINELLKNKKIKPLDLVLESFELIENNKEYNAFITLNKEIFLKYMNDTHFGMHDFFAAMKLSSE